MTRTVIFALLLTVLGLVSALGYADSIYATTTTSTSFVTKLPRSYDVDDLRHFMGFTLCKTTYEEIRTAWGEKGVIQGGPISANGFCGEYLSYSAGSNLISFQTHEKKVCETVDEYGIEGIQEKDTDYPQAKIDGTIVLPCSFYFGMKMNAFIKRLEEIHKASPDYDVNPNNNDGGSADEVDYAFITKKGPCREIGIMAIFTGTYTKSLGDYKLANIWIGDWDGCSR